MTNAGGPVHHLPLPQGILLSLGLMVCGTVLPYILYTKGLNDLGPKCGKEIRQQSIDQIIDQILSLP